ncbi:MAG: choice-of-anchor D domain-containing protein [Myxococcota bacterium]
MRHRDAMLLCACLLAGGLSACDQDYDDAAPRQDVEAVDASDDADAVDGADASDDADGTEEEPGPGVFDFSPRFLTFEDVEQGETASQSVLLKNLGESDLLVTDLRLVERADGTADGELLPGERWVDEELVIPPDIGKRIDVQLAPTDYATDSGFLEITVLADTQTQHVVPIDSINAYADISAPKTVRIGSVDVGETERRQVTIYNRGIDVLTVNDITLSGSDGFRYDIRTGSEVPDALQRGEYVSLDVIFEPQDASEQSATLTVDSSDPDEEAFEIVLLGNEPAPCIGVSTRSVEFGKVDVGSEARETITLLNCSQDRTLEVSDVSFSTSANGTFRPELPDPLPLSLLPTQTTDVDIVASSDEAREAVGNLTIRSNDTEQSPLLIDVRATFE